MIASPNKAPHANANKNLTIVWKTIFEQHFLVIRSIKAAKNPIRETANPAKNPKPQIYELVNVSWCSSPS